MHKKNRRHRQRVKREERKQQEFEREQVQDLFSWPTETRKGVRKAAELYSLGVCTEEETKQLFRRLIELGLKTDKVRHLCSVIASQSKIIKAEQEERKIRMVEMREFIPVAPTTAAKADPDESNSDDAMPQPIAYLEDVSEEEMAETLERLHLRCSGTRSGRSNFCTRFR